MGLLAILLAVRLACRAALDAGNAGMRWCQAYLLVFTSWAAASNASQPRWREQQAMQRGPALLVRQLSWWRKAQSKPTEAVPLCPMASSLLQRPLMSEAEPKTDDSSRSDSPAQSSPR